MIKYFFIIIVGLLILVLAFTMLNYQVHLFICALLGFLGILISIVGFLLGCSKIR